MSKMNRVVGVMIISYVAMGAWMSASVGFAGDAQRVDVVSHPQGTVVQMDSMKAPRQMRVDVIESSESGGARHSYPNAQRVDVIENPESEGEHALHTKPRSH